MTPFGNSKLSKGTSVEQCSLRSSRTRHGGTPSSAAYARRTCPTSLTTRQVRSTSSGLATTWAAMRTLKRTPVALEGAEDIEDLLETLFTHTHAVKCSLAEYQRVFTISAIPAKTQFEILNRQLSRIDFDSISEQTKRKL